MSQIPEVENQTRLEELRQALGKIGDLNPEPVSEGLGSGNIYQAPRDNSSQAQEAQEEDVNGTDIEIVKEPKIVQGMNQKVSLNPGLYLTITPVTPQDFEVYGPLVIKRSDYYLRTTLKEKVSGDLFFQPIDYRVVAYDVNEQKLYLTWEEGMPGR